MSLLASPRRRRRSAAAAAALACAGLIAVVVILDPGRSGPSQDVGPPQFGVTTTTKPTFATTVSAAEERDREHAEAAVRPLAQTFVNAMIHRTNLESAHALLAPEFPTGSVSEWQNGQHLPLALARGSSLGGTTIAYSGPREVGLIVAANVAGAPDSELVALKFDKQ